MITSAQKTSFKESSKKTAPSKTISLAAQHPLKSPASTENFLIQRKSSCACGGGCPRCKANEILLQPRLKISQPNDIYEQEADELAEKVMRMKIPEQAETDNNQVNKIQRKEAGNNNTVLSAPTIINEVINSPGKPLDKETLNFMEPRFGYDFSNVRIHDDDKAHQSSADVNALAYTVGNNIVLGKRQYHKNNLLAHELVHVIQQRDNKLGQDFFIQRDSDSTLTNVPYEKWAKRVEDSYRKAGLVKEAEAVLLCREWGDCSKILIESEVWEAYKIGQSKSKSGSEGPIALGFTTVAAERLETNLVRGVSSTVTSAGGGLSTIAVPLTLGVIISASIYDLFSYTNFQNKLIQLGYIILPSPLGCSISSCHQPNAPTRKTRIPLDQELSPPLISERRHLPIPISLPTPIPQPTPIPISREKEKEKRLCGFPTGLSKNDAIPIKWFKPKINSYYPEHIEIKDSGVIYRDDPYAKLPDGTPVGVVKDFWPSWGKTFQLIPEKRSRKETDYKKVFEKYGYDWKSSKTSPDHIQDLQWSGPDTFGNFWPMDSSANKSAGASQNQTQRVTFCQTKWGPLWENKSIQWVKDNGRAIQAYGRWFKIQNIVIASD